jgi:hypothetical protein
LLTLLKKQMYRRHTCIHNMIYVFSLRISEVLASRWQIILYSNHFSLLLMSLNIDVICDYSCIGVIYYYCYNRVIDVTKETKGVALTLPLPNFADLTGLVSWTGAIMRWYYEIHFTAYTQGNIGLSKTSRFIAA